MKKIIPDKEKEWAAIFELMDNKELTLTEQEVKQEVAANRKNCQQ
jgi:hypothetical protein